MSSSFPPRSSFLSASDVFKFMCFSEILNVRFTIEGFHYFFREELKRQNEVGE